MSLVIVGLGPGDPALLTRKAWQVLETAKKVHLRTAVHPTVESLPDPAKYNSFDDVYASESDFSAVYGTIVGRIVEMLEKDERVVYAVPGDPMVGEGTVAELIAVCRVKEFPVEIVHGVSFVEPALAAVGVDALSGVQIVDALDVAAGHHPPINPDQGALIAQIYNRSIASNVKLTLMNQYPDTHPVTLVDAAGSAGPAVRHVPLYEIDQVETAHLSTLYVPALIGEKGVATSFEGFEETIARLRAPDGCPWDREQTHESLRSYLIEEAHEVLDAIDSGDADKLCEELGDLLLQVVLHTQIAIDEGEFMMPDVIRGIDAKIKRRHPHVWGDVDVEGDPDKVVSNWEHIKAQERAEKGEGDRSLLDGVPRSLPALALAHEYDRRAAKVGFDWPDMQGVVEKIQEEVGEALAAGNNKDQFDEIGDLLLAVAVMARWLKQSPEDALKAATQRFYGRFTYIEKALKENGKGFQDLSFAEMDALWNEAKRHSNESQHERKK